MPGTCAGYRQVSACVRFYVGSDSHASVIPNASSIRDTMVLNKNVPPKLLQVCVDLMLWSSQEVREYYDVGTIGTVPRATGGRVTYLRGGEAGGAETASHLREQLRGALRDHARSASESVLKVGGCVIVVAGYIAGNGFVGEGREGKRCHWRMLRWGGLLSWVKPEI